MPRSARSGASAQRAARAAAHAQRTAAAALSPANRVDESEGSDGTPAGAAASGVGLGSGWTAGRSSIRRVSAGGRLARLYYVKRHYHIYQFHYSITTTTGRYLEYTLVYIGYQPIRTATPIHSAMGEP